jgi:predicted dinucleotide-binding enzyme
MSNETPDRPVSEAATPRSPGAGGSTRFGVLGTGPVGQTLGTKLVALGHEVCIGSREAGSPDAAAWAATAGARARHGAFRDAAAFGEVVINATKGTASLEALEATGAENLAGKVLIDVANAMDFTTGVLKYANDDSLAERIQRAYPEARVVKTLNTMNMSMFFGQASHPGPHNVFVAGNDAAAKAQVTGLLEAFGWERARIIDLGDITAARGAEGYMLLWYRLIGSLGTRELNIGVHAW